MNGDRVKEKREELNFSQQELADLADVSLHTVFRAEKGTNIQTKNLQAIASALKTSVAYLMGEPDTETRAKAYEIDEDLRDIILPTDVSEKNIIVERKDGGRFTLPETPEAYMFLERLYATEEISPEDKAVLKLMEDMTPEEKKEMFDFLSKKESKTPAG